MANTKTKEEYNPLLASAGLIGDVLNKKTAPPVKPIEKIEVVSDSVKEQKIIPKKASKKDQLIHVKSLVSKSDIKAVRKIVEQMGEEMDVNLNFSQLFRGWITRVLTAEKELIDAARHHPSIKTPNTRNKVEVADMDYALAQIQSVAFRRAKAIK